MWTEVTEVNIREKDGSIHQEVFKEAVVQKMVYVLFKEGLYDSASQGRSYSGILADVIERGDIETAKLLIDEFAL